MSSLIMWSAISCLSTDFKHRRTAAFENQRLYGQIECAIGGCLQGIVRRRRLHVNASLLVMYLAVQRVESVQALALNRSRSHLLTLWTTALGSVLRCQTCLPLRTS